MANMATGKMPFHDDKSDQALLASLRQCKQSMRRRGAAGVPEEAAGADQQVHGV